MKRFGALCLLILTLAKVSPAQTSLDTAVNFNVKDINGVTHQLFDYLDEGKIVLVDFFTVTCGPCATYTPEISNSFRNFGCNSGNVVVIGINWGSDNAQVIDFGQENGAEYPEVSGTEGNGNHVVSDFGILSYPTVILVKPDKSIPEPYIWPPSTAHLDSILLNHGAVENICHTSLESKGSPGNMIFLRPNPTGSLLNLSWQSNLSVNRIELFTLQGQRVTDFPDFPANNTMTDFTIDVSGFPKGYYLLKLFSDHQTWITKPLIVY
jgi:thiol-disulfide isomerase/thioredoxin